MTPKPFFSREIGIIFFLLAISWLIYHPVILYQFLGDDYPLIAQNLFIRSFENIFNLFSRTYISSLDEANFDRWIVGSGELSYRPLTTLSYMIDYFFWGVNPEGYHLTSLCLHSANVILFFFLTRQLFQETWIAVLAAIFFATHPVNAEAVSIISYRSDLLVALLSMGTFISYLQVRQRSRSWPHYFISYIFFGMALFVKESAIILPLLIIFYEFFLVEGHQKIKQKIKIIFKTIWPYFALIAFYLTIWVGIKGELGNQVTQYSSFASLSHWMSLCYVVARYLWQLLFPIGLHLTVFDASNQIVSFLDFRFLASVITLGSISAFFIIYRERFKIGFFSLIWFAICLAPFTPSLLLGPSRYLYLPAFGFFWVFSAATFSILKSKELPRWIKITFSIIVFLVIVDCGRMAIARSSVMKNQETGVSEIAAYYPKNVKALILKANVDYEANRWDMVIDSLKEVVMQEPPGYEPAHVLSGMSYYNKKMFTQSKDVFRKAIWINPKNAESYIWMGSICGVEGDPSAAEEYFKKALSLDPKNANAYFGLGVTYLKLGRLREARACLCRGEAADSSDPMIVGKLKALEHAIDLSTQNKSK